MAEDATAEYARTKRDFLWWFFSALRLVHGTTVRAKPSELHRAFHRTCFRSASPFVRKLLEETGYDYDPLYGQSNWLAIGITQASRNLLVELPTTPGRWHDIVIRFDREEAGRRLDQSGHREEFIALANEFVLALQIEQCSPDFFNAFAAALVVAGGKRWRARHEDLCPAMRYALDETCMPIAGHPVSRLSNGWLAAWMETGFGYLLGREIIMRAANPFFVIITVRLRPERAEHVLANGGRKDEFAALARSFLQYLVRQPAPEGMRWGAEPEPRS